MAGAAVKPVPFAYALPRTVDDALSLLAEHPDAVALAGGQSLVPMLNFRLARPRLVVDLNGLEELAYLRESGGGLRIGAMTRQAVVERSGAPLLADAVRLVGHAAIRSRGTIGGSAAHADPRAELPVALCALDARFRVVSKLGSRWVGAADFFRGPFAADLGPGELLVEIEVPPLPAGARCAFVEHARTHGDFAAAGVAVVLVPGVAAAIALLGAAPVPMRAVDAERALVDGADAVEVARLVGGATSDEYQRSLLAALASRALTEALA